MLRVAGSGERLADLRNSSQQMKPGDHRREEYVHSVPRPGHPLQDAAIGDAMSPAAMLPSEAIVECTLRFDEEDLAAFEGVNPQSRQLNGKACPPIGYSLAIPVDMNYTELVVRNHLLTTDTLIAAHKSWVGMILSLCSLAVGSYELYLSWANESPAMGVCIVRLVRHSIYSHVGHQLLVCCLRCQLPMRTTSSHANS